MFHSNKKKEKKDLTEEEQKKIEEKLEKIKVIQSRIIKMRKEKEMDINQLDFLLKAGILMPDFSTMWSYRKELLLHQKNFIQEDDYYKFLLKEVEGISGIMLKNPKSYVLWYHRIWCLEILSEMEKKNSKVLNESCLKKEIYLCNKFFEKDDRNFHVWNYRLTIFKMIYKYFPNNFWDFLNEELDFTLKMIKKSFSNFSAWHYRSKLISLDLAKKNVNWGNHEILNYLKDDLHYLKNAIFTDPRDQSPWNYYNWILTNITPIFIQFIHFEDKTVKFKLSQKIPIDKFLQIRVQKVKENDEVIENIDLQKYNLNLIDLIQEKSKNINLSTSVYYNNEFQLDLSNILNVENDNELVKFKVTLKPNLFDIKSDLLSEENLNFNNKFVPLKNNLDFPKITFTFSKNQNGPIITTYSEKYNKYEHLKEFFNSQINFLDELIDVTDEFLENAHFRKAQIMNVQYFLKFDENNKDKIKSELNLLGEKSKRMKEIYKNLLENI